MANWAIVIGINGYQNLAANLRGAVNDAVRMAVWLTSQEGGNVPPQNLFLLTSPTPPLPSIPVAPLHPNIRKRDATYDTLVQTGVELVNKSGGKGERLFFYFAGHGLINRQNFIDESVLALADFGSATPHKSITINSLREYFGNTSFTEQFFFLDACRNILDWKREFRVGEFPFPGDPDPARIQNVSQCVLSATSPRLRAVELNESGAFTEILLAGLGGAGKAKIYDKEHDEYVVRADRLFAYVEEEVRKKKILVTAPPAPPLYQRVYPEIKNVTVAPTLAHIAREAVVPERLELYVEPEGVWTQTDVKVRVTSEDAEYDELIAPIKGVPVELPRDIQPMSYTVRAEAKGYQPERRRWPFDLYEPTRLSLRLNPLQLESVGTGGIIATGGGASDGDTRGDIYRSIETAPQTASLAAGSSDPLAPIEIYNNKGELMAEGRGLVELKDLEPGFYRARLVTPEGKMVEELVELLQGDKEIISLDAPGLPHHGLFKEIVGKTDFHAAGEDGTLRFSEYVGPMATPQLTTMLALAGFFVVREYGWGDKVAQMGFQSFQELTSPEARNGVRVICADEASHDEGARDFLSETTLRLWPQDDAGGSTLIEHVGLSLSPGLPGIADFAREVEPGAYVLELNLPGRPPVSFALSVLHRRLTLFVLHRRADGGLRIFCYSPSLEVSDTSFRHLHEEAHNLRRLELLQRFYHSDRVNDRHALRNAVELLYTKWLDPLAGCLGGYTMLKLGQAQELRDAVNNMMGLYGELSDSHVLAAEHYLSQGNEDSSEKARESYLAALDRGLPVFAEGLLRLASGIERFQIIHPRADEVRKRFKQRTRHQLWTAWTDQGERVEDSSR